MVAEDGDRIIEAPQRAPCLQAQAEESLRANSDGDFSTLDRSFILGGRRGMSNLKKVFQEAIR